MKQHDRPTKYMAVANEIIAEIVAGKYKAGDKLYSRSEIMKKFGVGEVTAVRVQNYLEAGGLVRKAPRSGMYLCYDSDSFSVKLERASFEPPKRIIEFRKKFSGVDHFNIPLYQAIDSCMEAHGMEHEVISFFEHDISESAVNYLPQDASTGYICFSTGSASLLHSCMVLLNGNVKSVLVDGIIPQSDCVLVDSFSGMKQIIDYAYSQGCRNFIYAKNFCRALSGIHNEDREMASRLHCQYRNVPFTVDDTGNYDELLERVRNVREKTAVLFPQDDAAYTLKRLLGNTKADILITGFDDYCSTDKNDHTIPSIRWNYQEMAECIYELLMSESPRTSRIRRIPGELVNCNHDIKNTRRKITGGYTV